MLKKTLFAFGALALLGGLVAIRHAMSGESSAPPASAKPVSAPPVQPARSLPPPTLDFKHELLNAINLTDPKETQVALRAALEHTGASSAAWTATAKDSIAAWEQRFGAAGSDATDIVRLGSVQCYVGGCIVPVTFASAQVFDLKSESLMFAPDVTHWTGPSVRSSQVTEADGTVTVEWVLLNPNQG